LVFDANLRVAEAHQIALGMGGGLDIVRVEPGAPRAQGVTPSTPETDVVPVLRPELRYELTTRSFLLGAAAFADVSLARTHYDLAESGELRRLGTPWQARPGGALVLGVVY
jgi:hypothetical protein